MIRRSASTSCAMRAVNSADRGSPILTLLTTTQPPAGFSARNASPMPPAPNLPVTRKGPNVRGSPSPNGPMFTGTPGSLPAGKTGPGRSADDRHHRVATRTPRASHRGLAGRARGAARGRRPRAGARSRSAGSSVVAEQGQPSGWSGGMHCGWDILADRRCAVRRPPRAGERAVELWGIDCALRRAVNLACELLGKSGVMHR